MARVEHESTLQRAGPWLLDTSALEKLDHITQKCWEQASAAHFEAIERRVDQRIEKYPSSYRASDRERLIAEEKQSSPSPKLNVSVGLSNGRTLVAESVRRAQLHPEVAVERPHSLVIRISVDYDEYQVEFRRRSKHMRASAPRRSELGLTFISELREWTEEHGPKWWQTLWLSAVPLQWLVVCLLMIVAPSLTTTTDGASHLKEQARALAAKHVSEGDVPQALELLLGIESTPPVKRMLIPDRVLLWMLGVGVIVSSVMSIHTKLAIGMGRGTASVARWRAWMHVAAITIPSLLVGTFIWPWVVDLVKAGVS